MVSCDFLIFKFYSYLIHFSASKTIKAVQSDSKWIPKEESNDASMESACSSDEDDTERSVNKALEQGKPQSNKPTNKQKHSKQMKKLAKKNPPSKFDFLKLIHLVNTDIPFQNTQYQIPKRRNRLFYRFLS